MSTSNATLQSWVEQVARLTKPDSIHWCTGSDAENSTLIEAMLRSGDLIKLNQTTHPNCYLHRSNPSDVARVEHLTFVCTRNRDDAGPNNHWMDPAEAHRKVDALFDGDTYAPELGPEWQEVAREQQVSRAGLAFSFVTYTNTSREN